MSERRFGDGTMGSGTFGGFGEDPVNLHVVTRGVMTLTLGWNPHPDADGYRLYKNGVPISFTWYDKKTSWRVAYVKGDTFELHAIKLDPIAQVTV